MSPLASRKERPWWRDAVTYQIYPRSYADSMAMELAMLKVFVHDFHI